MGLLQHKTTSEESISTVSLEKEGVVSQVTKQIKVFNEEFHLNYNPKRPKWVNEIYFQLKERILNLGEVELKPNGNYISFRRKRPFVDVVFFMEGLYTIINMKEGTLNDPLKLMKTYGGKGHWGNGDYYITIDTKTDLDYMMSLINQSYKNQD